MEINTVSVIQAMLAPGIMISACGLLLLGMNNKYSMVVNRIRLLDDEKRRLLHSQIKEPLDDDEKKRINSIDMQIGKFQFRIKLVRNAVFSYSMAVAFFIIASLTIGLQFMLPGVDISIIAILLFLLGMISVFFGIMYAAKEVWKGYEIVIIEIREN